MPCLLTNKGVVDISKGKPLLVKQVFDLEVDAQPLQSVQLHGHLHYLLQSKPQLAIAPEGGGGGEGGRGRRERRGRGGEGEEGEEREEGEESGDVFHTAPTDERA